MEAMLDTHINAPDQFNHSNQIMWWPLAPPQLHDHTITLEAMCNTHKHQCANHVFNYNVTAPYACLTAAAQPHHHAGGDDQLTQCAKPLVFQPFVFPAQLQLHDHTITLEATAAALVAWLHSPSFAELVFLVQVGRACTHRSMHSVHQGRVQQPWPHRVQHSRTVWGARPPIHTHELGACCGAGGIRRTAQCYIRLLDGFVHARRSAHEVHFTVPPDAAPHEPSGVHARIHPAHGLSTSQRHFPCRRARACAHVNSAYHCLFNTHMRVYTGTHTNACAQGGSVRRVSLDMLLSEDLVVAARCAEAFGAIKRCAGRCPHLNPHSLPPRNTAFQLPASCSPGAAQHCPTTHCPNTAQCCATLPIAAQRRLEDATLPNVALYSMGVMQQRLQVRARARAACAHASAWACGVHVRACMDAGAG